MKDRMGVKGNVNESQFYMWRTLFAMAHADDIVTEEEIRYMMEALEDIPFSAEQQDILKDDIGVKQDIEAMFNKITDAKDQAMFFNFARDLVWVDGDYGVEEQEVMLKLKRLHIENVDVDSLIGNIGLQLESDEDDGDFTDSDAGSSMRNKKSKKNIVFSFRDRFLKDRGYR